MSDNVSVTAGSGTTIAADEVSDETLGSCKVQYVKIMDGTIDGTSKAAVGVNGLAVDVKAAVITSGTITTVGSVTAISNALPAGTNAIGKLAANSGVDIGDVDVTSIAAGDNNIGNVDIVTVPADPFGATADAAVTAGATGSISAKLRSISRDLVANIVLAAGTNGVGKLTANSGVDIGDVDVTSIVPGTSATALGKAIDTALGSTDTGVLALGVRDDALATLTEADGDVTPFRTNARGATWVALDSTAAQTVTLAAGTNTNEVVGDAAHDAVVAGNPVLVGFEARDTLGTAVATGDVVRVAANRYGFPLVSSIPTSHASSNGTPITATTTSVISAPSASTHLRVIRIHMSNGGATSTWVAVRDGAAGTRHYNTYLPQGATLSINLNLSGPLDLTTATRLDIVLSASGSVEYEIDYLTVAD